MRALPRCGASLHDDQLGEGDAQVVTAPQRRRLCGQQEEQGGTSGREGGRRNAWWVSVWFPLTRPSFSPSALLLVEKPSQQISSQARSTVPYIFATERRASKILVPTAPVQDRARVDSRHPFELLTAPRQLRSWASPSVQLTPRVEARCLPSRGFSCPCSPIEPLLVDERGRPAEPSPSAPCSLPPLSLLLPIPFHSGGLWV